MATINLGAIKFNWKGAYNSGTTYAVDDVVSSGGNSYVCIQAHSNQAVGDATAYWNIMATKGTNGTNGSDGTNGTDLSTTLTTQGDILYRDGSGLQRLAKGTANQELRINSGATAPEWHTPAVASSDFVRISSTNMYGSSQVDIGSLFDNSTYHSYKIVLKELRGLNGSNCELRLRYLTGSTPITADYQFTRMETFAHYGGSHNLEHHHDHTSPNIRLSQHAPRDGNNNETAQFELDFHNFGATKTAGNMLIRGTFYSAGHGELYNITGSAFNSTFTSSVNGIRLYDNNGNNTITGRCNVYGIK